MEKAELSVREKLLEAGKQEFWERGYEKASLRKICARAQVTTGALYFWFEGKADLFEQIVGGTIGELARLSGALIQEELADASSGVENEKRILAFLWKNRDVILILADKAEGTAYEGLWESLCRNMEEVFARFFQKYGCQEPDRELIHILVEMKMKGYRELVSGGYTLERTMQLAEMMGWYTDGGFVELMKKLNAQNGPADGQYPQETQNGGM